MTTVHTTLGVFKTHRRYEMRGIGTRRQFFLLLLTTAAALLWSASFAEGNAGAECETVACTNDPLCSNTQDPCSGKRCYFEGWGLNGLVKAKCHEESKQGRSFRSVSPRAPRSLSTSSLPPYLPSPERLTISPNLITSSSLTQDVM